MARTTTAKYDANATPLPSTRVMDHNNRADNVRQEEISVRGAGARSSFFSHLCALAVNRLPFRLAVPRREL
jgi:hypothetical protein